MGGRGIAPFIPKLGTRWRWVVSFTPQQIYPVKKPQYPLNRTLIGSRPSLHGFGEDKYVLLPPEFETRTVQLIARFYNV
jgi:hypothetical protein